MNQDNYSTIRIAGILNLTPDSFYSASRSRSEEAVRDAAVRILAEGADMLDIGACSTRPGSVPASEDEELARLESGMPVILDTVSSNESVTSQSPASRHLISVDTFRPEVARQCVSRWGVSVINDISGGSEEMYRTVAELGTGYILTYSLQAGDDVIESMMRFFENRLRQLETAGASGIILDPGFGFGKTLDQNYEVLVGMSRLKEFGLPVMAGVSRKSMAYKLPGITPEESLEATTALHVLAMQTGADWLRVHDVGAAVQAAAIFRKYESFR